MALASAGATALVQQMVTDGWTAARERAVAFFANRGTGGAGSIEEDLDAARDELVVAQRDQDGELMADVRSEWRARLRRALAADPAAAAELRALLDELTPPAGPGPQRTIDVHNTVTGATVHGTVVQTGSIGELRFGSG